MPGSAARPSERSCGEEVECTSAALRTEQLAVPVAVSRAFAATARAAVGQIGMAVEGDDLRLIESGRDGRRREPAARLDTGRQEAPLGQPPPAPGVAGGVPRLQRDLGAAIREPARRDAPLGTLERHRPRPEPAARCGGGGQEAARRRDAPAPTAPRRAGLQRDLDAAVGERPRGDADLARAGSRRLLRDRRAASRPERRDDGERDRRNGRPATRSRGPGSPRTPHRARSKVTGDCSVSAPPS